MPKLKVEAGFGAGAVSAGLGPKPNWGAGGTGGAVFAPNPNVGAGCDVGAEAFSTALGPKLKVGVVCVVTGAAVNPLKRDGGAALGSLLAIVVSLGSAFLPNKKLGLFSASFEADGAENNPVPAAVPPKFKSGADVDGAFGAKIEGAGATEAVSAVGMFSSLPKSPTVSVLSEPEAIVVDAPSGFRGEISEFCPNKPEFGARVATALPKRFTGDVGFTPLVCSLSGFRPSSPGMVCS